MKTVYYLSEPGIVAADADGLGDVLGLKVDFLVFDISFRSVNLALPLIPAKTCLGCSLNSTKDPDGLADRIDTRTDFNDFGHIHVLRFINEKFEGTFFCDPPQRRGRENQFDLKIFVIQYTHDFVVWIHALMRIH